MDATNRTLAAVDRFEFWVGHARIDAQILLPREVGAVVAITYSGASAATESHVYEMAAELRESGLGTVLLDCMPDTHCAEDFATGLRRYVPGMMCHRITGGLARLSEHDVVESRPLGCLGIGVCAGPAVGAAGRYGGLAETVVAIGGRPVEALALTDEVTAPTLLVRGYARLVEDQAREGDLEEMFGDLYATVRCQSVEPPFVDHRTSARTVRLAKHWLVERLVGRPPRRPTFRSRPGAQQYGLPPSRELERVVRR